MLMPLLSRLRNAALRRTGLAEEAKGAERRHYPRLPTPVVCRRVPFLDFRPLQVLDVSLSGARVYSDVILRPRERLTLEFLPPRAKTILVAARVARLVPLPPGSPAAYAIGLEFTNVSQADAERLRAILNDSVD